MVVNKPVKVWSCFVLWCCLFFCVVLFCVFDTLGGVVFCVLCCGVVYLYQLQVATVL